MNSSSYIGKLKNRFDNFFGTGFIILAILFTNMISSQQKALKQLTKEDYNLFSVMNFIEVSPNKGWLSYRLTYESGRDTLYVQNIKTGLRRSYPATSYGVFNNSDWYASKNEEGVRLENLASGENEIFSSARDFKFTENGNYFVTSSTNSGGSKDMISKNLFSGEVLRLENVDEFIVHPSKNEAFVIEKSNGRSYIVQIDLTTASKDTIAKALANEVFSNLTILGEGRSLVFASKSEEQGWVASLNFYALRAKELKSLRPDIHHDFDQKTQISFNQPMYISEKTGGIYFYVEKNKDQPSKKELVQVWDTKDKYIYPQRKYFERSLGYYLRYWNPIEDSFVEVTNDIITNAVLTGTGDHAIVWDSQAYEPQYNQLPPRDYYVMDIKTGNKKLFLENHNPGASDIFPSPDGKYIAYLKEDNWWIYDLSEDNHRNLTSNIKVSFLLKDYDKPGVVPASGPVVWSRDGKSLFLEDQFDIWNIDLITLRSRRLTDGKNKKIKFSLAASSIQKGSDKSFYINTNQLYQEREILIHGEAEDGHSGYFKWYSDKGLKEIVFKDSQIFEGHDIDDQLLYMEERFDLPTRFMVLDKGRPRLLFQSNPQRELFNWSGVETIHYTNSHGNKLKGLLYYPFNFKEDEKYPIIVRIYERQYDEKHIFHIPTIGTSDGYNPVNYTSKGYFVFLPDIVYEIGNPAKSAADCTISAVETLLAKNDAIDPENVGLMGHSFGGYETNYIVTQTDMFKTAVAGAGYANVESYYLSLYWDIGLPHIWRIENWQMRMNSTLFENWRGFHENSPVYYANQMNTPLLTWAGKNDYNVNWDQNVEWFMALRRLNKNNVFLLYPNAGHSMVTKREREDLAYKVEGWFDYYLNEGKKPNWLN